MYDSKLFKHSRKLKTHWLGPYVVKEITDGGAVKLEKFDGIEVRGLINGSQLKPYFDNRDQVALDFFFIWIVQDKTLMGEKM